MNYQKRIIQVLLISLITIGTAPAQMLDDEFDKCGYNSVLAKSYLQTLGANWGYGYDSLLTDLSVWEASPYVAIDSLGASVQNRTIWQLTITSNDITKSNVSDKQTVFFHTRTHPGEVQSWRVTEQVINILLSESDFAQTLRQNCIFYILPMYNPDGVELEYARENANGVDLESNWNKDPVEPEVAVLRQRFTELMESDAPINVAMNMHSAYGTYRYFVFHDAVGTSELFTVLEKEYIGDVRQYYFNGIEPWDHRITWTTGTPTHYPESWFWLNYQEAVMALTYEDWNSDLAGNFDSTAHALLHGIADYLDIETAIAEQGLPVIKPFKLLQNYPNPFNPSTYIEFELTKSAQIDLSVFDSQGKLVTTLVSGLSGRGRHKVLFDASSLATGVYYYRLKTDAFHQTQKMLFVK